MLILLAALMAPSMVKISTKVQCHDYSFPSVDGCNTTVCKKCTDGERQWDDGPCFKTTVACNNISMIEPGNPGECLKWNHEKNEYAFSKCE